MQVIAESDPEEIVSAPASLGVFSMNFSSTFLFLPNVYKSLVLKVSYFKRLISLAERPSVIDAVLQKSFSLINFL